MFAGLIALAIVFALLALMTIMDPQWIEQLSAFDPDRGTGKAEWGLTAMFGVASLLASCTDPEPNLRQTSQAAYTLSANDVNVGQVIVGGYGFGYVDAKPLRSPQPADASARYVSKYLAKWREDGERSSSGPSGSVATA